MIKRTYTVLVTITDKAPYTAEELANRLSSELETGGKYRGVSAASVDVIEGDVVEPIVVHRSPYNKAVTFNTSKIKHLHAELVKP